MGIFSASGLRFSASVYYIDISTTYYHSAPKAVEVHASICPVIVVNMTVNVETK